MCSLSACRHLTRVCLLGRQEEVNLAKEEWELGRLKAMKEHEERRAELEDDEMLYTYGRHDAALSQVNSRHYYQRQQLAQMAQFGVGITRGRGMRGGRGRGMGVGRVRGIGVSRGRGVGVGRGRGMGVGRGRGLGVGRGRGLGVRGRGTAPLRRRGFGKKLSNRRVVPMGLMDCYDDLPPGSPADDMLGVDGDDESEPEADPADVKIAMEASVQAKLKAMNERALQPPPLHQSSTNAQPQQRKPLVRDLSSPDSTHSPPKRMKQVLVGDGDSVPKPTPGKRGRPRKHPLVQPPPANKHLVTPHAAAVRQSNKQHNRMLVKPEADKHRSPHKAGAAVASPWNNPNLVIRTRKAAVAHAQAEEETDSDIEVVAVTSAGGGENMVLAGATMTSQMASSLQHQQHVQPVLSKLAANLANVSAALAQQDVAAAAGHARQLQPTPTVSFVRNIQNPGVSLVRTLASTAGQQPGSLQFVNTQQSMNSLNVRGGIRTLLSGPGAVRLASAASLSPQKVLAATPTKLQSDRTPILEKLALQLTPPRIKSITALPSSSSQPLRSYHMHTMAPSQPAMSRILVNSSGERVNSHAFSQPLTAAPTVMGGTINTNVGHSVLQHASGVSGAQTIHVGGRVVRVQRGPTAPAAAPQFVQRSVTGQPSQLVEVKTASGHKQYLQVRQIVGSQPQQQTVVMSNQHLTPVGARAVRAARQPQPIHTFRGVPNSDGGIRLLSPPNAARAVNFVGNTIDSGVQYHQSQNSAAVKPTPHRGRGVAVINAVDNPVPLMPKSGTVITRVPKPKSPEPETIVLD